MACVYPNRLPPPPACASVTCGKLLLPTPRQGHGCPESLRPGGKLKPGEAGLGGEGFGGGWWWCCWWWWCGRWRVVTEEAAAAAGTLHHYALLFHSPGDLSHE